MGTGCGSCYCLTGCVIMRSVDLRNIHWSIFEVDRQLIVFGSYNFCGLGTRMLYSSNGCFDVHGFFLSYITFLLQYLKSI